MERPQHRRGPGSMAQHWRFLLDSDACEDACEDPIAALLAVLESDDSSWRRLAALQAALYAVDEAAALVPATSWGAQLLAEAVNWAAKTVDPQWYAVKPLAWALAFELGCAGGWGDDGCFYLSSPEAGVSCAHDPGGELRDLVPERHTWPHAWSGIYRQDLAWEIIRCAETRSKIAALTAH